MIKRLRIRFILISMVSVTTILGIILLVANIVTYNRAMDGVDMILNLLIETEGEFTPMPNKPPKDHINEETPFETRFFIVEFKNNGDTFVHIDHIAAIEELEAIEMGEKVIESKKTIDMLGVYRYKISEKKDSTMIIFIDCTRQLNTITSFLRASMGVALIGLLGVFILVYILSKPAVMPIVKSYEKQRQFITDASHELKTPLTIISANNELIEMDYGKSEFSEAINKQVDRLNSLVKDMIILSKIEEDNRKMTNQEISISECVLSVCENHKVAIENNNKEFIYEIEEGINLFCEESLIRRLMNIVLDNANKYSSNKVKVVLQKKSKIEVIITNDTDNIDNIEVDKIFNRFYRSINHRSNVIEGSGIGLAVAKEIVKLHNGDIKAYKNQNNEFEIKIVF